MNIVISPDSFKESLSAKQVINAIIDGWESVKPSSDTVNYTQIPIADGGEGMMEALLEVYNGTYVSVEVDHPLSGQGTITAQYTWIPDKKLVVIESASAIGLDLIAKEMRNPLDTSSYGLGQLIMHAYTHYIHTGNAENILIGIGGTATVDGGLGMIQALGVRVFDSAHNQLGREAKYLKDVDTIDTSHLIPLHDGAIIVASDVRNVLYGEQGAAKVFGTQKGASPSMINELEKGMMHFAQRISHELNIDIHTINSTYAGAAGGLGMAFPIFCNAHIKSGIDIMADSVGLETAISNADLVITGEGKLDGQSLQGKVIFGVLQVAQKYQVPICIIAGALDSGYEILYEHGVHAIFSATPISCNWDRLQADAYKNVKMTAKAIARMYYLAHRTL